MAEFEATMENAERGGKARGEVREVGEGDAVGGVGLMVKLGISVMR